MTLPRNRWLAIGGLSVLVIAAFALFVISRVQIVTDAFFSRTDLPETVTAHYFEAIRNQNYAAAYTDLDEQATVNGQPIDEPAFIQQATQIDAQRGRLDSYGVFNAADDASQYTATLRRGANAYSVNLKLRQAGNRWKIISLDGL